MKPYLTADEIAEITDPLTQGAARIRFFKERGCKVFARPNGQPLVHPAEWEEVKSGRRSNMSEAEIVALAQPFEGVSGVYFLITGDRVVYVGQSSNVYRRVMDHRLAMKFERWHYVPCAEHQREEIEAGYIKALNPMFNRAGRAP